MDSVSSPLGAPSLTPLLLNFVPVLSASPAKQDEAKDAVGLARGLLREYDSLIASVLEELSVTIEPPPTSPAIVAS